MTSSKDTIQETIFPEAKQAEEIARLAQQEMSEKQQAFFNFQKEELEINRERGERVQENTARYDADSDRLGEAFRNAPQASWSQYQALDAGHKKDQRAALLRYSNTGLVITAEHKQQIERNTAHYNNQMLEIERRFKANRLAVVQKYQRIRERREEEAAKMLYERVVRQAWDTCDESIRQAKNHLAVHSKAAHVAAVQETNAEVEKFHQARLAVREESYLMLAEAVGLDGITDDIWSYVSKHHKYASVQPLLGYTDLRLALAEAVKSGKNSSLIDNFYSVTSDDENIDVSELEAKIQSLDLAATSQLFKHECVFMAAPAVLEKNKLYIDLKKNSVSCTLLSPYGDVMSKLYTKDSMVAGESLKAAFQRGNMREYIQKESLYFVMDINYGTPAGTFDAFTSLIDTQKGFKAHVMNTIVSYNRELARFHCFDSLKLCKKHLSCSSDRGHLILEETPLYQLREPHNKMTSDIGKRYRAECEVLEKACEQAILEAEALRDDAGREAAIDTSDRVSSETDSKQEVVVDESAFSPVGVETQLISPLAPQVQAKAEAKSKRRADRMGFFEANKFERKPINFKLDGIEEDETSEIVVLDETPSAFDRVEEKTEIGKISGSYEHAEIDEDDPEISRLLGGMGLT